MTEMESKIVVGMLLAAYPREMATQETVQLYQHMIADLPFEEARDALKRLIATRRWSFPTVADIRTEVVEARLELPSPADAVAELEAYSRHELREGEMHNVVRQTMEALGIDGYEVRTNERPGALRTEFRKTYEQIRRAVVDRENLATLGAGRVPDPEPLPTAVTVPELPDVTDA
jgi:hypothetical protein